MIITPAIFAQLAAACAPGVHVDTLSAIANVESRFHSGAINDNTDKRSYLPGSQQEAIAIASDLVATKRHVVDIGLMQINSSNLASLNLSVADAFDPCKNISAAAKLLAGGYRPTSSLSTRPALLEAVSRYNTGHPQRGFANGYVAKVLLSADHLVPSIRTAESRTVERPSKPDLKDETAPPGWDVFAQALFARRRGQAFNEAAPPVQTAATGGAATPVRLRTLPVQLHGR